MMATYFTIENLESPWISTNPTHLADVKLTVTQTGTFIDPFQWKTGLPVTKTIFYVVPFIATGHCKAA